MILSASKYVSIEFAYQHIYILNNKERLNGIKVSTKMQNRESLFKYQQRIYNVKINSDVNYIGMKILRNNKLSP